MKKQDIDETIENIFEPLNNEGTRKIKQTMKEVRETSYDGFAPKMPMVRQRALLKYFDRLCRRPRKGSDRTVRRFVSKWLDDNEVYFTNEENSFSFLVQSKRYTTSLYVSVVRKDNQYYYSYTWHKGRS